MPVDRALLDDEEQQAMDALLGVMTTITRRWGMTRNSSELASAVHVLQGFIVQHMLHRVEPEHWSSWETPVVESLNGSPSHHRAPGQARPMTYRSHQR